MKAIDVLRDEHAFVRRLLSCLGAATVEARILGSLDVGAAQPLLSLFELFVDWSHQDKEELHLFPHLMARATPQEAERVAHVLAEHHQERRRLTSMYLHLDGACRGEPADVERFIVNSLIYQRLQRKHVDAEESYVLPLGEAILTPSDDRRIVRGYREIDRRLGALVRHTEEIAALCERFDVEDEPLPAASPATLPELIPV